MLQPIEKQRGDSQMNGYSIIFTAVLILILAATAGVLSFGLIRGANMLTHHPIRRRHHRS
jgi:hypothetical protein